VSSAASQSAAFAVAVTDEREQKNSADDNSSQDAAVDGYLELLERYHGSHQGRLLQIGCGPSGLRAAAVASAFDSSTTQGPWLASDVISSESPRDGLYDILMVFVELVRARNPQSFRAQM
jgi:hypothetical protein